MLEIKVSDVLRRRYNEVSQISKNNNKPWVALTDEMKDLGKQDVLFDFHGIDLLEPWANMAFREFMQNEHVYMRVYSSDKVQESVNNWCMLAEVKSGRVENVKRRANNMESLEEQKFNNRVKMFMKVTTVDKDGVAYVDVDKQFSNLGDIIGPKALIELARQLHEDQNVNKVIVDTGSATIEDYIVYLLAEAKYRVRDFGVDMTVISDYAEKNDKLNTHEVLLEHKDITPKERVRMFAELVQKDTIGMLSKYANGKGRDEFGRHGNGRVVKCVPAIFRGICNNEGKLALEFDTYKVETFCTVTDYKDNHDGEDHPGLEVERRVILPEEVGLASLFVGGSYHFNMPVQFNSSDSRTLVVPTERGYEYVECTLPEYIKAVAKDFDLDINMDNLDNAIELSKKHLASVINK